LPCAYRFLTIFGSGIELDEPVSRGQGLLQAGIQVIKRRLFRGLGTNGAQPRILSIHSWTMKQMQAVIMASALKSFSIGVSDIRRC